MGSIAEPAPKPWVRTPCIRSAALSKEAGCNIYLKLDNLQPSGSFKSRGIGNLISRAIAKYPPSSPLHFYCSSGGNAGLACVTAANTLSCSATIVVPFTTSAFMIEKLKAVGANVVQEGSHWKEADTYLREVLLEKDEWGVYVPPFDHEDLWDGHGSLVDELEGQMAEKGGYEALVASVGGGGLFIGLMEGLERHGRLRGGGRREVKMVAMETKGADSLAYSLKEGRLSRLASIESIAGSLGATQVAEKAYEWAKREEVVNIVLDDAEAAIACVAFADDERIMVEVACGVSVATAYNGTLRALYPHLSDEEFSKINIVIVVCGGSNVSVQTLVDYKAKYGQHEDVIGKFHLRTKKMVGIPDKTAHSIKKHSLEPKETEGNEKVEITDEKQADRQLFEQGRVITV